MPRTTLKLVLVLSLLLAAVAGGLAAKPTPAFALPATHFAVSAPASATAGSAFTFTVTALDALNAIDTTYGGTVHFTSTDGAAVLPANSTLIAGTGTFSATLKTAGSQTITATDTVTSSITGTSNTIAVSAAAATHFAVSAPSSATAGTAFNFTVTAQDAFNNTATGYIGTVHFTSSDGAATLPANSTLTNGTGTFSSTLRTAGNQTITATDTANSSITGTSNTITVSPAAATHFLVVAPASATGNVAFNFTVTAQDQFNNTATGYVGTVHFTSTDVAAILPADSTLTNGVGTFSATLKTAGNQTITATDTVNSSITGTSNVINVTLSADLALTKIDSPDPVNPGNTITYALILTNNGPSDAQNITITDVLPIETTLVSATAPPGGSAFSSVGTVTFTLPTLAPGAPPATGVITVQVISPLPPGTSTVTNTATVTSAASDSNSGNNTATAVTTVSRPDLQVTKTASPNPVPPGGNITYSITLANIGTADATSVQLTELTPANTTFVSFSQGSGPAFSCSTPPGTVSCSIANFPIGASASFQVVVTVGNGVPNGTTIINTATATTSGDDLNGANNSASATTAVATPDLSVTKTASPSPVNAGANITYTLTLTNNGPVAAPGVQMTDTLPANTTFVSFSQGSGPAFTLTTPPPGGTGNAVATLGNFASGASATFTLVLNVNAATPNATVLTNTVTASSALTDPNPANNTATTNTTVAVPDLTVTKTASPNPVVAGTNLTYTLTVTNTGTGPLTNVSLTDALPISTPFLSLNQSSGPAFTCTTPAANSPGTVTCTIASLAGGASAVFSLVVHVNANLNDGFVVTNTATVASSPVDANPANNTATSNTTVRSQADVGVTKTDAPDPVVAGTNLTYTITVTNNGPSHVLTGLTLTDAVPAGTTFVAITQVGPAFTCTTPAVGATGNISCTIATFTAGAVTTFTLVVNVNTGTTGSLTNTATVSSTTTDPNAANNSATATTAVTAQTDLAVTKTAGSRAVFPGNLVVYSLGITNNGPSDAAAVNLSDPLPAHMTFVSLSQASGPVFVCTTPAVGAAGTVTCTIASLANGASASFTLTARLTEFAVGGVTLTNTATATTTSTDAVPANNTASATVLSLFLPLVQPAQNFVGSGVLGPVLAAAERVNRASQAAAVPTPAPAPVAAAPARAITPPSTGDAGLVPPNDNSLSVGSILLDVAGVLAVPALLLALVRLRQRRRLAGSARGEH